MLIISVNILQAVNEVISLINALKFSHLLSNTIVLLTQYANINAAKKAKISLTLTFNCSSTIPVKIK